MSSALRVVASAFTLLLGVHMPPSTGHAFSLALYTTTLASASLASTSNDLTVRVYVPECSRLRSASISPLLLFPSISNTSPSLPAKVNRNVASMAVPKGSLTPMSSLTPCAAAYHSASVIVMLFSLFNENIWVHWRFSPVGEVTVNCASYLPPSYGVASSTSLLSSQRNTPVASVEMVSIWYLTLLVCHHMRCIPDKEASTTAFCTGNPL